MIEPVSPVRVQLNLPALERLLGGDTEMEAGLRTQIVREFCKKHLERLALHEALQLLDKEGRDLIRETFLKEAGAEPQDCVVSHALWTAKERFKKMVEAEVRSVVATVLTAAVQEAVHNAAQKAADHWVGYTDRRIQAAVNDSVTHQVKVRVEAILAEATKKVGG